MPTQERRESDRTATKRTKSLLLSLSLFFLSDTTCESNYLRNPLMRLAMSRGRFPRDSVRFANPGGRTSPTDFATAVVAAVLVVQLALDQEDPASSSTEEESSSEASASSGSDSCVTLYFTNARGRTSPTSFATVVASALVLPITLDDQECPEDSSGSDSVEALCFPISRGRASDGCSGFAVRVVRFRWL